MGYFEVLCQLCAVSFAIARHRTATEPPEAAWGYSGAHLIIRKENSEGYCPRNAGTGCSNIPRDYGFEHLGGPGCRGTQAYSGANISLAEMKGCRDVRAIVKKCADQRDNFPAEDDDEPWEQEGRYFFSGTGNGSPEIALLYDFDRIRHGVRSVFIPNVIVESEDEASIPVHPTCWEVFKRVSVHALGRVDVHGLWKYRTVEDGYDNFFKLFPRHAAVRRGDEQWWRHERGSEWLAANPVDVPGFAERLGTHSPGTTSLDVNGDVFDGCQGGSLEGAEGAGHDPFTKLPAELRLMVQDLLPSRSIAALRLASRPMRPVPNIAFRRLLSEDMPWLWEARDLAPATTDWFGLYKEAKSGFGQVKGLKNRVRIWGELTEICDRIRGYRKERQIQGFTGWEDYAEDQS